MNSPINHDSTPHAVCPYCGHINRDSWELLRGNSEDGETDCGECCKPYRWSVYIEHSYTTYPISPAENGGGA